MHFVHSQIDTGEKQACRDMATSHLCWSLDANDTCTCNVKTLTVRSASCSNLGLQKHTCYKPSPIPYIPLQVEKPLLSAILN